MKFFDIFQGRSTFFAAFFAIAGTMLAFKGILTPTYVTMIGAIQALVLAHSVKEDLLLKSGGIGADNGK